MFNWLKQRKPTHVDIARTPMGEHIVIPLTDMPKLAEKYVTAMETEESANWCRCEWIIHPDDVKVKAGYCRICGAKQADEVHEYEHDYRGKRMRRMDDAPDCPVHTKEGFLLYFLQWVMDHAKD